MSFFFNLFQINSNKTGGKNINMFAIHLRNSHSAVSDREIRSWNFILPFRHVTSKFVFSMVEWARILSLSNGWLNYKFIWRAVRRMPAEFWSKRTRSNMQNPFRPTIGCFKVDGGVISSTHWEKTWNQKIFFWKMSESSSNQQFLEFQTSFFFQWCCYSPIDSGWERHGITPKEMMIF